MSYANEVGENTVVNKRMKVINLFGAPGAGKSTTMLDLTSDMKLMKLPVENTPEFYKELILEGTDKGSFGGQGFILMEQNRRLDRLRATNDFAVTDCPLPLITYYTPKDYVRSFETFADDLFNSYDNINYFIVRKHDFEKEKRIHSEEQSDKIAEELLEMLDKKRIPYKIFESCHEISALILEDLVKEKIIAQSYLDQYVEFQIKKVEQIHALGNKFKVRP